MKSIDMCLIQARLKRIKEALQEENLRHQERIKAFTQELEELMIAERVVSRLVHDGETKDDDCLD